MSKKIIFWLFGIVVLLLFIGFLPIFIGAGSCRPVNLTCSHMRVIKSTLKMFKLDNGVYPTTEEGFNALIKNPNPKKYSNYASTAYLEKFPYDTWQNPMLYIHFKTDKRDDFQLISLGADGKYGGEKEHLDIIYPDSCR